MNDDLPKALDYATRAASVAPESAPVRDTLGWTYFRLGRFEEALAELQLAIDLGGADAVIFEHLGDAYDALGRGSEARAAWMRALEADPTRASSAERLGTTPAERNGPAGATLEGQKR